MSELEFWYRGVRYVTDVPNIWLELDERHPGHVVWDDPDRAESIIREVADPVACSVREGDGR